MRTIFTTSELHPRDRFEKWHEIACRKFVQHDSMPDSRLHFDAELAVGSVASLGVFCFKNSPMLVERNGSHIAGAGTDHIYVCRQLTGRVLAEQDGREIALEPGALTCIDPLLPYQARFADDTELLLVKVPRDELQARIGPMRDLLARVVVPSGPEQELLMLLFGKLPDFSGDVPLSHQEMIATQTLDLLALTLAETGDRSARLGSGKALSLARLHAAVEARLRRADLDAQTIASAAGLSVRQANKLLAGQGTSLMRLLQERRLARCRRALQDPAQLHRSVSEIALSWGFSDLTHFGRCFKKAYGLSPSDFRAAAQANPARR